MVLAYKDTGINYQNHYNFLVAQPQVEQAVFKTTIHVCL